MISIYAIVRIQLSFVQFSSLCCEFCILSKAECKSIYYHLKRDHESSSIQKLARNKWICQETCDFFYEEDIFSCSSKMDLNYFLSNEKAALLRILQIPAP